MAETTENLFSADPAVLIPLVHGGKVNGHPVLDYGTDGAYTYVLCFTGPEGGTPFVTWSVWRHESGKVCAGTGHYFQHISDAVIDLRLRADGNAGLDELAADVKRAKRS